MATFAAPDGTRLTARLAGPDDAPPLILVHGFSMWSGVFARQLEGPLATRFRIIAPDLRGHGASAVGPDLSALGRGETWAGDLAAAIAAFARRPPIVAGWSFGGRVVCAHLAAGGAAAGAVFINAVSDDVLPDGGSPHGPGAAALPEMMSNDPAIADAATTAFVDGMTADALDLAARDRILSAALGVPPTVRRAMRTMRSENSALLNSLQIPVLAVHGARDRVIRPAAGLAIAAAAQRGTLAMMENVGHAPFLEDPDGFDAHVDAFAKTHNIP
ncbi:MAG: alpha/beta hydrolase [Pseudomonadota bacterium]